MKNKRMIVVCLTAIILIITGLLYFSYGYYMTNITGTDNSKKLTSLTKIFKFEFSDGTEKLVSNNTNFIPGSTLEKTFTIVNKSTEGVYFNIDLDGVTNTFSRFNDIIYEVYYNDKIISTNIFPTMNVSIATNLYIEKNGTRTYMLKVKYLNSEENQINDMGKSISADIVFSRTDSPKTKFNILGNSYQGIPVEYQEVEYIESTGTQYIDTNINANNLNLKFESKYVMSSTQSTTYPRLFGAQNNTTLIALGSRYWYGDSSNNKSAILTEKWDDLIHTLKADNKGIYIDNDLYELENIPTTTPVIKTPNILLFTGDSTVMQQYSSAKIYYFKIYDNDDLIRNFIPCYRKSDNVVGMYDTISDKFYINSGTETFKVGTETGVSSSPDNPNEIVSLGSKVTDESDVNYEKYKLSITGMGKNLFNINECINGIDILDNENGSVRVKSYPSNTLKKLSQLAPNLKVGDEFVFSMETNGYGAIYLLNQRENYSTYIGNKDKRIVTQKMLNSVVYLYRQTSAQGGADAIIKNIQIEIGKNFTEYEPYQEPITANLYLNEPLRCVGNVCDYIDLINKKVIRSIATTKITDLKNLTYYEKSTIYPYGFFTGTPTLKRKNGIDVLSNVYKNIHNFKTNKGIFGNASGDNIYIVDDSYTNVDDLTTALKDGEVQFILNDSTTESIALPDISNYDNRTLYVTDGTLYSSKIEIE